MPLIPSVWSFLPDSGPLGKIFRYHPPPRCTYVGVLKEEGRMPAQKPASKSYPPEESKGKSFLFLTRCRQLASFEEMLDIPATLPTS